jgi:hypothetical protein
MLNVESGKKLFENGKYIDIANHEDYNTFTSSGVIQIIKPIQGYIYCPNDKLQGLETRVTEQLLEFEKAHADVLAKYKHLCGFVPMFSGESEFTIAKINIQPTRSTAYSRYVFNSHKRAIIPESIGLLYRTQKNAIFTWILVPESKLFSIFFPPDPSLSGRTLGEFKYAQLYNMLFSVFYDENDQIICKDNERVVEYVNMRKLSVSKNLLPWTLLRSDKSDDYKTFRFMFDTGSPWPIITYNDIIKGDINLYCLNSYLLYNDCFYRRDKFYSIPQEKVPELKFEEVRIDNSLFQQRDEAHPAVDNDKCAYCRIPLYGQIFLVFPDKSVSCFAVCKICAHVKFRSAGDVMPELIYRKTDSFAYTIHPRTHNQVLQLLFAKLKEAQKLEHSSNELNEIIDIIEAMYSNSFKKLSTCIYLVSAQKQYLAITDGKTLLQEENQEIRLKYSNLPIVFVGDIFIKFMGDISYLKI